VDLLARKFDIAAIRPIVRFVHTRHARVRSRVLELRSAVLGIGLVLVTAACNVAPRLPTIDSFNGNCRGVGLSAHVTGDASDPRVAWVVQDNGGRRDVIWPPGYTARFTPKLEILDENGIVRLRDGDAVDGGCVTGPDGHGPLLIAPGS
jgi:hypothetical protein